MGIFTRVLVPRSVRRATHPVRTVQRAVTPKPIRRVRRTLCKATNPVGALEGAFEDAVVSALRRGGKRRRSVKGPRAPARSTVEREVAVREAAHAARVYAVLARVHQILPDEPLTEFEPVDPVDAGRVQRVVRQCAMQGVSFFDRKGRREARAAATAFAARLVHDEEVARTQLRADQAARLMATLGKIRDNDQGALAAAVERFFSNSKLVEGAPVRYSDGVLSVVVAAPGLDLVPERLPDETPTGRPTTRALSKTERNEMYAKMLFAYAGATMLGCFAAAPCLAATCVLVLSDPTEEGKNTPVLYSSLARAAIPDLREYPSGAIGAASDTLLIRAGRTHEVRALDQEEPRVAALLSKWSSPLPADQVIKSILNRTTFEAERLARQQEFAARVHALARAQIVDFDGSNPFTVSGEPEALVSNAPLDQAAALPERASRKSKVLFWLGLVSIPFGVFFIGVIGGLVAILGGLDEIQRSKKDADEASRRKAMQAIVLGCGSFVALGVGFLIG